MALTAVRAIVAATADPSVKFSIPGLMQATGLSEEAIEELLCSPQYREMIVSNAKTRIAGVLQKGITRLEAYVSDLNAEPDVVLEAVRSATTLYRTMNQVNAGHQQTQSRKDAETLLKELTAMGALKQAEFSVPPPKEPSEPSQATA